MKYLWWLLLSFGLPAQAVVVTDDVGRRVALERPAERIVGLAPHVTELLYAAGAGERMVGTVLFSDYPEPALQLPRVGEASAIDLERLLTLRPDLVVAWHSGTPQRLRTRLEGLGLTVYYSEPRRLEQVATNLERLGWLAGSADAAESAARAFRERLETLSGEYAGRPPVSVFYQLWDRPLFTIGGTHLINEAIGLCGGRNVFSGLTALAPQVSTEAVFAADPQVIIASGESAGRPAWLDDWRRFGQMRAVREGHLYWVPPDTILRPSLRILQGVGDLCRHIDKARREQ